MLIFIGLLVLYRKEAIVMNKMDISFHMHVAVGIGVIFEVLLLINVSCSTGI